MNEKGNPPQSGSPGCSVVVTTELVAIQAPQREGKIDLRGVFRSPPPLDPVLVPCRRKFRNKQTFVVHLTQSPSQNPPRNSQKAWKNPSLPGQARLTDGSPPPPRWGQGPQPTNSRGGGSKEKCAKMQKKTHKNAQGKCAKLFKTERKAQKSRKC